MANFYSPKVGAMKPIKRTSKTKIKEYYDILSKAKSSSIFIDDSEVWAESENFRIRVLFKLGVTGEVETKDFKSAAKLVGDNFQVSGTEKQISFHWGESDKNQIRLETKPLEQNDKWRLGKEIFCFQDMNEDWVETFVDFPESLMIGGSSCAAKSDILAFNQVFVSEGLVISCDNSMMSVSEIQDDSVSFSIPYEVYKLWIDLNLPMRCFCVYENGIQIMLRNDVIITSLFGEVKYELNDVYISKIREFQRLSNCSCKLSSKTWKLISNLKEEEKFAIKNGEIFSYPLKNLRFPIEEHVCSDDEEIFVFNTRDFLKLYKLWEECSDFKFINIEKSQCLYSFVLLEIEPGLNYFCLLSGLKHQEVK